MQLTMLVVPSGRGQRPLCVHTGTTEVLGGSSFVVIGGGVCFCHRFGFSGGCGTNTR